MVVVRRLVLVAGSPSHARGEHEFRAGVRLLARCLAGVPDVMVDVHEDGDIPEVSAAEVSAIVLFSDGGPSHPLLEGGRRDRVDALARAGVGLGFMHYAIEPSDDRAASDLTRWIGGHYAAGVSGNPIWEADVEPLPDHPITRGVSRFRTMDEWYIHIDFGDEAGTDPTDTSARPRPPGLTDGVIVPILVATPSDAVRAGPYVWPAGPYEHIVAASGRRETLMWAIERADGGRGFGLTGGHFHANWGNDDFRRVVLNALVWVTGAAVPSSGVVSTLRTDDLESDLDA